MNNLIGWFRSLLFTFFFASLLTACGGGSHSSPPARAAVKHSISSTAQNPAPLPSSSRLSSLASSLQIAASSRSDLAFSSIATATTSSITDSSASGTSPGEIVASSSVAPESSSAVAESSLNSSIGASSLSSETSPAASSSAVSSSSANNSSASSAENSSGSSQAMAPARPKNLTSLRQAGIGISLQWEDMADNETAYVVKRAAIETPTTWVTLTNKLPANSTQYIDKSITSVESKAYIYQIRAAIDKTLSPPLNSTEINLTGYQHPKSGSLMPVSPDTWDTATWKLGSYFNGEDLEVAVYSKNAERVLLEVYTKKHLSDAKQDKKMAQARQDYWLVKGPDNIWRGKLAKLPEGTLYAFRAWGPNWNWSENWHRGHSNAGFISDIGRTGSADAIANYSGHRFNPNKLLTDPYSYELSHDTGTPELYAAGENESIYSTGGADLAPLVTGSVEADYQYKGPITDNIALDRRNIDTALWAPKSVAVKITPYTFATPNIPEQSAILMEASLRGLSKHPSTGQLRSLLTHYQQWFENFDDVKDIPDALRGTYKGAALMAPYLKALGINVIELEPIQETRNDSNDLKPGSANFWGYMTYSFFAPDRRFSSDKSYGGPTREFREMVEAFNKQGIEVWMDVVYNHTGEGGNWNNPFITGFNSYGGFDTEEYYHLNPFDKRLLEAGATGTGNQLNFSRTVNHNLVLDSLAHWIDNMGISGFRFDLAPVLGRDPDLQEGKDPSAYWSAVKAFDPNHRTLIGIRDLALDREVKIIAEAWDNWGYEVGNFPLGWGEWNGRFRDSARKYLKGDASGEGGIGLNDAFHGDYNHFNDNGGPHKSINFLVAHDGFTLADLVSYNTKTNLTLASPFGPSDGGSDNNLSWDSSGTAKPANLSLEQFRRQRLRSFWTFQFFSRGTPMIVYGDEFGRTQNGNNNPYNIDSPATWNNYTMLASNAPQSVAVHPDFPMAQYHNNLGTASNADAALNPLLSFAREIIQRRRGDSALSQENYRMPILYTSETGGSLFNGARARRMHLQGSEVGGSDYVLFINMWTEKIDFTYPTPPAGKRWVRIIDTAHWAEAESMNTWSDTTAWPANNTPYGVNAWSIAVFKAVTP
ncbi:MAG TPA: alpha-amylase family glycosyl hydrolase [Cellvibrio sp.]|nr:alpha-amylase family glycosyl hydrolase [Cellvibrio sp.]